MEPAIFIGWLVLVLIHSLPVLVLVAFAPSMHGGSIVAVLAATVGSLVYADLWSYRHLADDALNGLYFFILPIYITAGVFAVCLIDVLVRIGARRLDRSSS